MAQLGIMNYIRVQISPWEGAILRKGSPIVKYRHFVPWAVQERLNWSICRFGCGLRWAEVSKRVQSYFAVWVVDSGRRKHNCTSSIIFARWRQCAHKGGHIGATWRIRLKRPFAAAMRSNVKLLWPLVVVVVALLYCLWYDIWYDGLY